MKDRLDIRYFAHSWVSDWNHGNAHFLRGLARELQTLGHTVRCYEALGSWSLTNLIRNEGKQAIAAIDDFRQGYPELDVRFYDLDAKLTELMIEELKGADIVIFHEWNDPMAIAAVLAAREKLGFRVLLHDTHHRAYTDPSALLKMQLHLFDGVLAYGEAIRKIYSERFGIEKTWTLHEAADVKKFHPLQHDRNCDVLWIGNWGDEERTRELFEFLVEPAKSLSDFKFAAYGVRYPESARQALHSTGVDFRGYLPNLQVPAAYAASALALHIPRRHYTNGLSGIPTIRMFEAMACGAALVCSPWMDLEGLFREGEDYIAVPDSEAMKRELLRLMRDPARRRQMGQSGLQRIRKHHTCAHRAEQLTAICKELLQ